MAEAPERISVLIDMNKQIVTVASAMVALAATFATGLIGNDNGTATLVALGTAVGALVVAVCCALIAHAVSINYCQMVSTSNSDPEKVARAWNRTSHFSNGSFYAFVFALVALVIFGGLRLSGSRVNAATAIGAAAEFLVAGGKIQAGRDWTTFAFDSSGAEPRWAITFRGSGGATITCLVSVARGALLSCV